ncbi:hypothetical protein [Roseiconus lacunae]|uniref:Secreted protein n=1 Tax=Roseiconus lacunae TaxID=2605694 RepID=A0ABT7PF06_9BACT|nr:hypothetical protein [Roseiconus lacunae]MDM4015051.1 hypothetical protein [Roseiconus lacunae]
MFCFLSHRTQRRLGISTQWVAIVACSLIGNFNSAFANPSINDPNAPLPALGVIEGAEKQIRLMYDAFTKWEQLAANSYAAAKTGNTIPHAELSKTYVRSYQGIWYAQHLQAMGEPAGYDLEQKFVLLRNALGGFAGALSKYQPKHLALLKSKVVPLRSTVEKANELLKSDQLEAAEQLIREFHLKQLASVFYLTHSQSKDFENAIAPLHNRILRSLNQRRRNEYRDRAQADLPWGASQRQQFQVDLQDVLSRFDESDARSAEAITSIGRLWTNAVRAITRSEVITLAFATGGSNGLRRIGDDDLSELRNLVISTLNEVIRRSAQGLPPDSENAPAVYAQILKELSIIDRRCHVDLEREMAASLEEFLDRFPELSVKATTYRAATEQPMKWMHRFAEEQRTHAQRAISPTSQLLDRKATAHDIEILPIYRQRHGGNYILTPKTLSRPCNWVVAESQTLLGEAIRDSHLHRHSEQPPAVCTQSDARYVCRIAAPPRFQIAEQQVYRTLLIAHQFPPLSYQAANAITSIERLEYAEFGGSVSGLTLAPIATRFGTDHPDESLAIQLDRGLQHDPSITFAKQVIWEVDVTPHWIQHDLYFAELPSVSSQSSIQSPVQN